MGNDPHEGLEGMPGIAEAAGVFGALKTAYELVQDLRKTHDARKLKDGIDELADRLLQAHADAFRTMEEYQAAVNRANAAEAKLQERVNFEKEAENFVRHYCFPGVFVYREKTPRNDEEKPPNYCAHCFGRKKLVILQATGASYQRLLTFRCPECGFHASFHT
jgi:hypothetical protein